MEYGDKHILVLGAGASGIGASWVLAQVGAHVVLNDYKPMTLPTAEEKRLVAAGVNIITGRQDESLLDGVDRIVISPGISLDIPIVKAAQARGIETEGVSVAELVEALSITNADLSVLTHESELELMRKMADFTDLVAGAARDRAPFRLTHYAQDLAALFHSFYTNCRAIGEGEQLEQARLALADSARIVLALALGLLGVSAPEHM